MWRLYLVILFALIVVTMLYINGTSNMKKNYPNYKNDDWDIDKNRKDYDED